MSPQTKKAAVRYRVGKAERIETRVNSEQKRRIEYAAGLKGTTISDFMIRSAEEAAARAIREHETWVLTGRDRDFFIQALLHPPAPGPTMRKAFRRHKQRVGNL